ncbi:MAG TPA: hypothetical protein VG367_07755 [Mucilaginibacter sp.]|jgi:hypothetical protein|nr:hypothetical protein [Mucilaginibacter sp.]
MKRSTLRITLLTLFACLSAMVSKAQNGYNYSQYDLGASVGFNSFYGDTETPQSTKAITFNFNYNQTAFVNYILEFQAGTLKGGDAANDLYGRQFAANYTYLAFRVQVQAGELIDYSRSDVMNFFKNFYVGAGIGMIYSNITSINRYSSQLTGFYTPGTNSASQLFLPARIGYELKIFTPNQQPDYKIDIGYQLNNVFGDELDGFKAGSHGDAYGQFTIGVKISIGGVTSYRKQIKKTGY